MIALLRQGAKNREIAGKLEISESTVEFHLANIMRKLHVRSRVEVLVALGA